MIKRNREQNRVDAIDNRALLEFTLPIVLNDGGHFPLHSMQFAVQECAHALASPSFENFVNDVDNDHFVRGLIAQRRPTAVAAACCSLWMIVDGINWAAGLTHLNTLIHRAGTAELRKAFFRNGVYQSVIHGYWELIKASWTSEYVLVSQGIIRMIVLSR